MKRLNAIAIVGGVIFAALFSIEKYFIDTEKGILNPSWYYFKLVFILSIVNTIGLLLIFKIFKASAK